MALLCAVPALPRNSNILRIKPARNKAGNTPFLVDQYLPSGVGRGAVLSFSKTLPGRMINTALQRDESLQVILGLLFLTTTVTDCFRLASK